MKYKRVFVIILYVLLVFLSNVCKKSEIIDQNSNIEVKITSKLFELSTCNDGVSSALSLELRAILQNISTISGKIEDWKLDFYSDSDLLFSVTNTNYEEFACGNQTLDISNEIVTSGFFTYRGFVQLSLSKDLVPNKATITMSIKDNSGYTYQISNTY